MRPKLKFYFSRYPLYLYIHLHAFFKLFTCIFQKLYTFSILLKLNENHHNGLKRINLSRLLTAYFLATVPKSLL